MVGPIGQERGGRLERASGAVTVNNGHNDTNERIQHSATQATTTTATTTAQHNTETCPRVVYVAHSSISTEEQIDENVRRNMPHTIFPLLPYIPQSPPSRTRE